MFPNNDSRRFSKTVIGDDNWFHYFTPDRKCNNKIWAIKTVRRPCIVRRLTSVKKVKYLIF
jgi:hypothetical protein